MGWWKIEPDTGMPVKDSRSALSQPPEFVLLNAVPGVDDDESVFYLGDSPWDLASTVPDEVDAVTGTAFALSAAELRELLLQRTVPPRLNKAGPEMGAELLQIVDAFWNDIDGCYEDDWGRPAHPAEKRWVCEYAVKCRSNG
ncbi:MAG TPA: hypothetical protein VKE98_20305 [Gemmataceae bacterium]|nr:hypothetical protein [Gemmataceae bacterium]